MNRPATWTGAVACLLLTSAVPGVGQDPPAKPTNLPAVQQIDANAIRAFSGEKGKVVIGSLGEAGHGHVVIAVPGSDRVWDGNTLGGLKDLNSARQVSNPSVLERMNLFLKTEFPKEAPALQKPKNPTPAQLADYTQKLEQHFAKITPEQKQKYLDRYLDKGAPVSQSWGPGDRKKIEWFQVPTDRNVKDIVKSYQPPTADSVAHQNLRCNDLVQKVAPVVRVLVSDEVKPGRGQRTADVSANNIDRALKARVQEIKTTEPRPAVARPPEPAVRPIFEPTPRERKVETKPGGVIISAVADIDGLKPGDVSSASFDPATGTLTLALRSGTPVTYALDADDFTVAVRSIFDRQVDPSLSMSFSDKPGYHAVNYCGPLFKTRFGKVLFETDSLLGAIIFNREGDHRQVTAEIVPQFVELANEAYRTMTLGSRVFLQATAASYSVRDGRLVLREVRSRIEVEGLEYAASYYQESLHRLARTLDKHFDGLAEHFEEFQDFRRLAECVALAKWIKRHGIAFDWRPLATRTIAECDFPAYAPAIHWYSLFNGRNLDGWNINLRSRELAWEPGNSLTVKPTGTKALELMSSTWRKDYDVRFTVVTRGPVEFVIRKGQGDEGAVVTLDTGGRPQRVELFLVNGEWTAVAPGFGKSGKVNVPPSAENAPPLPGEFGIRVPPGSTLTLFTASLRGR